MNADPKERVIDEFERVYHEIETKLLALSAADLERPVFTGEGPGWRIRDIVPHLARWNRMATDAARKIAAGAEPPPEAELRLRPFVGITDELDTVNDKQFQAWRERPVDEAFTELSRAHSELMDALRALPAERVVKPDGEPYRYFWQPGLNHLRQHWAHIAAALKETATS